MKKRVLPFALIVLALAAIAALLLFGRAVLRGDFPSAKSTPQEQVVGVTLGDEWAAGLTDLSTTQGQRDYLAQTVAGVKALGANAVFLTGRTAGGAALFRDATDTLLTSDAITQSDRFFSRFDALRELVRQGGAQGVEVVLLASATDGTALDAAQLASALPVWLSEEAARHSLRIAAPDGAQAEGTAAVFYRFYENAAGSTDENAARILRADGSPSLLSGAVQLGAVRHVILGDYTALCAEGGSNALLYTGFVAGDVLPDITQYQGGKTIAETLAVTYPTADNSSVTSSQLFLMGTSNPAEALTLNGEAVQRYGTKGVWGILVSLQSGATTFALQNGGDALEYTVTYKKAAGGSYTVTSDGSVPAKDGQKIRITDAIASALAQYGDSSSIHETLYTGATAAVVKSVQYTSGAKKTYAYQLATGDYVRSATCELITEGTSAMTAAGASFDSAANSTVLSLSGGTPAVFHTWEGNTLTLTFLSAGFDGDIPAAEWYTCTAENGDDAFTLTFTFTDGDPLYGWAVNYDTDAGTTRLYLKHTPKLSADRTKPLSGITVMLDAGHGGSDLGAMGSGGQNAPAEKELNLSVAQAAKYRLEQLGATVLMTREDDGFPSLGDRVTAMNTQHPDLFIAIHHNSLELTGDVNLATGTEAYWFFNEGEALAENLVSRVTAATGRQFRSVKYGYYYVTRSNICPATLLEIGFMTNPAEYEICASTDTIWTEAGAIAQGVYDTIKANG